MKAKEYRRLKTALEAQAKNHEEAAATARRELEALETVWALSRRMDGEEGESWADKPRKKSLSPFFEPVKSLLPSMPEVFTWLDVQTALQAAHDNHPDVLKSEFKRTTLVGILNRLVDEKLIEVAEKGIGRRAAKYRRRVATAA